MYASLAGQGRATLLRRQRPLRRRRREDEPTKIVSSFGVDASRLVSWARTLRRRWSTRSVVSGVCRAGTGRVRHVLEREVQRQCSEPRFTYLFSRIPPTAPTMIALRRDSGRASQETLHGECSFNITGYSSGIKCPSEIDTVCCRLCLVGDRAIMDIINEIWCESTMRKALTECMRNFFRVGRDGGQVRARTSWRRGEVRGIS